MIYLGNLSIHEVETRLGVQFSETDRKDLQSMLNPDANVIEKGKVHFFDIPFFAACGDAETAIKVVDILTKYDHKKFQCVIQIGVKELKGGQK